MENIDCVVNYDHPQDRKQWVHRAGRTGRGGKDGIVLCIVDDDRTSVGRDIEDNND